MFVGVGTSPVSGSISVGAGRGSSDHAWVNDQTSIIARDILDARVEGHTQIDGAVIASLTGDLTLDTGTLGFSDIHDHDKGSSWSAQAGISASTGEKGKAGYTPTGAPTGASLSGHVAEYDREQETRATVGAGEIIIRDTENQTQDVAALNRDLDKAQEITKDERSGVEFYVSDTAVREAIKAVEFVGKTLAEISTGVFGELGRQGNATFSDLAAAKERGALSDADIVAQLGACNPSQGFNLFDLFIGTAHAAGTCQVKTADGQTITFSGDDRQKCLEAYMAMMAARPDTIQQIIGGLTLLNSFAGPLGNHAAIYGDGPVIIGTDENGGNFGAVDESGRLLYQNRLTGEYFFANPNDPGDQKVIETAFDIAGIIAGASAASKIRIGGSSGVTGTNKIPSAVQPVVGDPKLQNLMDNIYKGTNNPNRVGDGTLADAVRYERETGGTVGGRTHTIKAQETVRGLQNWLDRNPHALQIDRQEAITQIQNLKNALGK